MDKDIDNVAKDTAISNEEEFEKCKALAFYLIRLHRVAPEGRKQKKSRKEIDKMSASTVDYMIENLEPKILAEYRSAIKNNK